MKEFLPDAASVPVSQATPAGNPGPAAHLLGQHVPREAAFEDEYDAGQAGPITDWRTPSLTGLGLVTRQQRFDY